MSIDESGCPLAERECIPCRGGVAPLKGDALAQLSHELDADWEVVDEHHLEKDFRFPDFRTALDFAVAVGELAESIGHHPDLHLSWGHLWITLWTHKIDGLATADFVMAAKIDRLRQEARGTAANT